MKGSSSSKEKSLIQLIAWVCAALVWLWSNVLQCNKRAREQKFAFVPSLSQFSFLCLLSNQFSSLHGVFMSLIQPELKFESNILILKTLVRKSFGKCHLKSHFWTIWRLVWEYSGFVRGWIVPNVQVSQTQNSHHHHYHHHHSMKCHVILIV